MLPITGYLSQIAESLHSSHALVLQAEPGAGKSTALPIALLNDTRFKHISSKQKIIILEPRRVAAKSIAHFIAKQLGEKVGQRVGYQVKNDRKISENTELEIVTEGILTQRLQGDPELSDVGLIIFDEFHERSLQSDLALMLSYEVQQSLREDLKLLVMSATIDTQMISSYLNNCAIIECPGRTFPISVSYQSSRHTKTKRDDKHALTNKVIQAIISALNHQETGDILVFLPGQADITRSLSKCQEELGDSTEHLLLPLYGSLTLAQQERAISIDAEGRRRIIFATNIAETSLTIEGVTCVIDSGLEKQLVYEPNSGLTRLETNYISKASAEQRKGRAGRIQPGHCIRLWREEQQNTLKDYSEEEIISADLCSLYLELAIWGEVDLSHTNWLTPPPSAHIDTAKQTLLDSGLIEKDGKVTQLGKCAARLALHPRLARMVLSAKPDQQSLAIEIAALLTERDIFYQSESVDIAERLIAIQDYKLDKVATLKKYPIQKHAIENLLINIRSITKQIEDKRDKNKSSKISSLTEIQQAVGELLFLAYPDRLSQKRSNSDNRYLLANGKGAYLNELDPLINSEWLVVCDCDALKKEARIFTAASIDFDSVKECCSDKLLYETNYEYDEHKKKVIGHKITRFGKIILSSTKINDISPTEFQLCLQQILEARLFELINWTEKCEQWLQRATWLSSKLEDFPRIDKSTLGNTINEWLLPYLSSVTSIPELKKIDIYSLLLGTLSWDQQQTLEQEAPIHYISPSQKTVPIRYDSNQGPTVSIVLQEMFGELKSPAIAYGQVPLRFELLSPARRPIQTTSDLANFWQSSYFEVAKDMKGRYPKHRWPDDPLNEKPGKSIKRK